MRCGPSPQSRWRCSVRFVWCFLEKKTYHTYSWWLKFQPDNICPKSKLDHFSKVWAEMSQNCLKPPRKTVCEFFPWKLVGNKKNSPLVFKKTSSQGLLLMEKILHQLIGRLSPYLHGFVHLRWLFGISSINSMSKYVCFKGLSQVSPPKKIWRLRNPNIEGLEKWQGRPFLKKIVDSLRLAYLDLLNVIGKNKNIPQMVV